MTRLPFVAPFVLLGLSCVTPAVSLRPTPHAFTGRDYARVYRAWTRSADDFSFRRLSTVLHVTATLQSSEFRWAYVVRYAADHALAIDVRERMLMASLEDSQQQHRFVVTLAGPDYRESDLTAERAAWRVILIDENGRQTLPSQLEKIGRPSAAERLYFPSISPQRHAFRIAFPVRRADGSETIGQEARRVVLRFTGPLGAVDLAWEFGGQPLDSAS